MEAVAAYREALQELTRERVPLRWAMSTGNQGVALMLLAERRRDAEMAKLAVQQIEAAFTTRATAAMRLTLPSMKRNCRKPAPLPKSSPSSEVLSQKLPGNPSPHPEEARRAVSKGERKEARERSGPPQRTQWKRATGEKPEGLSRPSKNSG
jgi:hypothetical protein